MNGKEKKLQKRHQTQPENNKNSNRNGGNEKKKTKKKKKSSDSLQQILDVVDHVGSQRVHRPVGHRLLVGVSVYSVLEIGEG